MCEGVKTKEEFVDTINTSDPDLVKSITTLGQIVTDLQDLNGLTVPGKMNCISGINVTGLLTVNSINILAKLNSLSNDVKRLRTDVNGLRTDVNGLRTDVDDIKKTHMMEKDTVLNI